jgi:hypothetical protein
MQETRDKGAYRLVVGGIGLALVVTLAGICLILAFASNGCDSECASSSPEIPSELWKIVSALGGGLLGVLAPQPTKHSKPDESKKPPGGKPATAGGPAQGEDGKTSGIWTLVGRELKNNITVFALLVVFGLSAGFGIAKGSTGLESLAAASGAALLGLLAPTPAHTESDQADSSGAE